MEFNEEFRLACGLHNGLDPFKFDPGPLYASSHICATQIRDRTVSVSKWLHPAQSDNSPRTCFGSERWQHSNFKGGKDRWMIAREDVVCATWQQTYARHVKRTIATICVQSTAFCTGSLPGQLHRMWFEKNAGCNKQLGYCFCSRVFCWDMWEKKEMCPKKVETTQERRSVLSLELCTYFTSRTFTIYLFIYSIMLQKKSRSYRKALKFNDGKENIF